MILLDTSGVIAALFPDQSHHEACAKVLREAKGPRVMSAFVLAEIDYLITKYAGVETEIAFLDEVGRRAYEIYDITPAEVGKVARIVEKYKSLNIGLADASTVFLAERSQQYDVLTLDHRHFRALKAGRKSLRILPADL